MMVNYGGVQAWSICYLMMKVRIDKAMVECGGEVLGEGEDCFGPMVEM